MTFSRAICGGSYHSSSEEVFKSINCTGEPCEEPDYENYEKPGQTDSENPTPQGTPNGKTVSPVKGRKRAPRKTQAKEEIMEPKRVKKEAEVIGPHHCKLCSDTFFTELGLNQHEKAKHADVETYQCKICNYCSLEKSLMIRHMRTHSGQRPFNCTECGYAFTTKANCERHIRKRHEKTSKAEIDSLIRCDLDQLKSVSEDSWKYEVKTVCMHCDEKFEDYWSLRDHLKIHDKRSFYCSECNAAFSCRSNCIAHIMQKHNVTDREEANEKVKYDPGEPSSTPKIKIGPSRNSRAGNRQEISNQESPVKAEPSESEPEFSQGKPC